MNSFTNCFRSVFLHTVDITLHTERGQSWGQTLCLVPTASVYANATTTTVLQWIWTLNTMRVHIEITSTYLQRGAQITVCCSVSTQPGAKCGLWKRSQTLSAWAELRWNRWTCLGSWELHHREPVTLIIKLKEAKFLAIESILTWKISLTKTGSLYGAAFVLGTIDLSGHPWHSTFT